MSSQAANSPNAYPPSETALLLLDFHNALVQSIQPDEAQENLVSSVKQLLTTARQHGVPVVHGLMDFKVDPLPTIKRRELWESSFKPMVAQNPETTHEWSELAHIEDNDNEVTALRRPAVLSAMKSEGIMEFLTGKHKVRSLVICGIVTSGVVLSAAREAADLGFVVSVVEEGCWDRSDQVHRTVLDAILTPSVWTMGLQEALKTLGHS